MMNEEMTMSRGGGGGRESNQAASPPSSTFSLPSSSASITPSSSLLFVCFVSSLSSSSSPLTFYLFNPTLTSFSNPPPFLSCFILFSVTCSSSIFLSLPLPPCLISLLSLLPLYLLSRDSSLPSVPPLHLGHPSCHSLLPSSFHRSLHPSTISSAREEQVASPMLNHFVASCPKHRERERDRERVREV